MPIPQFLSNIFGKGAGNIVESIGNVADKFIQTKEEKDKFTAEMQKVVNDHTEKMAGFAIEEMKIELEREKANLADTSNARESNVKIQESDKASWLSKNVAYMIDCFVLLIWGCLTIYLIATALKLLRSSNVDLTGIYGLYASVTAVAMTIINFHRGSSIGSERKQKQIDKMSQGSTK